MKSLARQEVVHVCWPQYLSWVIKEIPKKDRPICHTKNTSITGTTKVRLINKKTLPFSSPKNITKP